MAEEVKQPKVEAFLSSLIDLQVRIDDRPYHFHIPNGVSYEEATWVCDELKKLIQQLKEQNEAKAKEKEHPVGEAIEPEIVS